MQAGDALRGVEEDRGGDVDGVGAGFGESLVQRPPRRDAVGFRPGRIARDQAGEAAARLGKDGRENALFRDVADAGDEPLEHMSFMVGR